MIKYHRIYINMHDTVITIISVRIVIYFIKYVIMQMKKLQYRTHEYTVSMKLSESGLMFRFIILSFL